MFIIDLTLKNTAANLSVQRKTAEDAEAVYQDVLSAMRSGTPLELTCEQMQGKKLTVLSSEIIAVQLSEKSSTASSGRPPGFLALATE